MTPERWARIRGAVEAALDAQPEDRAAILEKACTDDVERQEALALLEHDDAGLSLRSPCDGAAEDVFAALEAQKHVGRTLGRYRLTALVATGGMGDVYKGERIDGAYDSTVAVKLVRAVGAESRRRFARERRTLARLSHPCIARLIDAGEEDDVAWLAMEFVEGRPLLEHGRDAAVHERIRIMRDVCAAVAHAHRMLIVHRDLKPANILVDADGAPKLLDFGVSKLLAGADEPQLTSARLFTPRYAAPEQICAEPVTTATDVYALGVVLYELLAGKPWPEAASTPPWERRPARPSDALARADRELDAIVLQAAATDPGDRYPSADAMRADLDRYLEGRPVRALPASRMYQARKWAGRNKPAIAAISVIALLLSAAIIAPTILAVRLAESERRAVEATRSTERINTFLSDTIKAAAETEHGADLTLSAILDDALARLPELDDAAPAARAELHMTLAGALSTIGRVVDAESQYALAVADYRSIGDDGLIHALLGHGMTLRNLGRFDDAKAALHEVIDLDPDRNDRRFAHHMLAFTHTTCGEFDHADAQYQLALGLVDDVQQEIELLDALAEMYSVAGRADEAIDHRRRIVELRSDAHPSTLAHAHIRLARALRAAGEHQEAVDIALLAVEGAGATLDADYHRVEAAMCLEAAGDPEAAITMLTSAVGAIADNSPPDNPTAVYFTEWLGLMLVRHDRFDEARPLIDDVVHNYNATLGEDHQRTRYARRTLDRINDQLGR